jgi:leucyl-tRNA synthetase
VICRCATRAIVKVVEDQWFMAYGDPEWKKRAHAALDRMTLHPEAVRKQFHHTIDWLNDWPCAHHRGLGTKLPWDEAWVIESLSDSTVYMAYYTIAHALQGGEMRSTVPWAGRLDDAFFDYVFRGLGEPAAIAKRLRVAPKVLQDLRREFTYWYPVDLRHTGKDLIQNHMTFTIFVHEALFPDEHRPRGFGIIGHLALGGRKMSKSKGNVWYLRDAMKAYGADLVRLGLANAGDGLDDPNFDADFVESMGPRLQEWVGFATARVRSRTTSLPIDKWFRSTMNRVIAASRAAMEAMEYRAALRHGYFDLQSAWSWYVRRSGGVPHVRLLRRYRETVTKVLAPFTPHLAEEVWSRMKGRGFIAAAPYPEAKASEIDAGAEAAERYLRSAIDDVREILKVTSLKPRRIVLYTAPEWMRRAVAKLAALGGGKALDLGTAMKALMEDPELRSRGGEVQALAKRLVPETARLGPEERAARAAPFDERVYLLAAKRFLEEEFKARVEVFEADGKGIEDPKGRARLAVPWRPAIYVE